MHTSSEVVYEQLFIMISVSLLTAKSIPSIGTLDESNNVGESIVVSSSFKMQLLESNNWQESRTVERQHWASRSRSIGSIEHFLISTELGRMVLSSELCALVMIEPSTCYWFSLLITAGFLIADEDLALANKVSTTTGTLLDCLRRSLQAVITVDLRIRFLSSKKLILNSKLWLSDLWIIGTDAGSLGSRIEVWWWIWCLLVANVVERRSTWQRAHLFYLWPLVEETSDGITTLRSSILFMPTAKLFQDAISLWNPRAMVCARWILG